MLLNNEKNKSVFNSLAGKLAILYATTTFSVLLIASGVLYWSVLDHLQREHQNLLITKISDLRQYFKTSSLLNEKLYELIDVQKHHTHMPHSSAIHPGIPHHVLVRILNEQDDLIVESATFSLFAKKIEFPAVNLQDPQSIEISRVNTSDKLLLLGSTWVDTSHNDQPFKLKLQVILELAPDETLLSEYQNMLIAVLFSGVLASALAGFWVTRRGLRPLRQMTQAIQTISAQQLSERVDSEQWPREISLLAKAFDDMLGRLDHSFNQLSQFSADLAHELRTPVNNLMGEAEVALSRDRNTEEYQQILESSIEECSRIARMIDELLFLARAENPKTEINRTLFNIDDEFLLIKDFYEGLAAEHNIKIECNGNQQKLWADSSLIRRVLSNLISNAIRYSKPKGTISLVAHATKNQSIKIICQ